MRTVAGLGTSGTITLVTGSSRGFDRAAATAPSETEANAVGVAQPRSEQGSETNGGAA
jgi:NAD(P)-dependent dehydrogenase (short-subunit alcohol dehydrogenase family)